MGYAIKHGSNNNGLCVETPNLNRVGRAGHGRHGGEASALCVGSDDVGLELLFLFFQEKRKGKKRTAAIDALHRTGQRRHDMAA